MGRKYYMNHSILDRERGIYIADVLTIISSHNAYKTDALDNCRAMLPEYCDSDRGTLIGKNLDFNKYRTDEGLFYVNRRDKTEVRVERFFHEEIGLLHFRIPALERFLDYNLEFRKRYSQNNRLKALHRDSAYKIA